MIVKKISEHGLEESALGFSLSYNSNPERAKKIFSKYAFGIPGERKFLESIITYWEIDAPRGFWQEFDTYRIGVTKQSESTMHTLSKRFLFQEDFEKPIYSPTLNYLNYLIANYQQCENKILKYEIFEDIKWNLPEGFLQNRVVMLSYKTLQEVIIQRSNHRLKQWKYFIDTVLSSVEHKEFLVKET